MCKRSSSPTLLVLLLASIPLLRAASGAADALDDALALEGLERADLGWRPRGWWSRFPADTPHRLRHFDDLLAEPLATHTFARTAAVAAREQLADAALARRPEKSDGALYKAVQLLGVDRRFGGFRSYSANLEDAPVSLADGLVATWLAGGRQETSITFGNRATPELSARLAAEAAAVPEAARPALGRLLVDLVDAHRWIELAFRRVAPADRLAVARRLDLGDELTDAQEYFPAMDDVALALDEASLWYGGLKAVAAGERARHDLAAIGPVAPFAVDLLTPLGWVRLRGGGADTIDGDDTFLVVDLGGDDVHRGAVAAPLPGRSLSMALDLGGADLYEAREGPAQGAGLAGVGVLLDAAGADRYRAGRCSQGFGQLGLGVLADLGGDDQYEATFQAQGSGLLGIGLLLEVAGGDRYLLHGDGQGYGGAGGVGVLADRSGDDSYSAERDPKLTGRPSSHSENRIAISSAQGAGMGRRGDGSDGHSWAGGLGMLLDSEGADRYSAGDWAQGTGYWFGTGILHDGAGDDAYHGVWWAQGAGAHFAIGALFDEGGADQHLIEADGKNSLAFGHDFTVALLVNRGGNDRYQTATTFLGGSINRSVSLLLDQGGDDAYLGTAETRCGTTQFGSSGEFVGRNTGGSAPVPPGFIASGTQCQGEPLRVREVATC